jgi:hypothetical protein
MACSGARLKYILSMDFRDIRVRGDWGSRGMYADIIQTVLRSAYFNHHSSSSLSLLFPHLCDILNAYGVQQKLSSL